MKNACKIIFIFMILGIRSYGQTGVDMTGVSASGTSGDIYQGQKADGLLAVWNASSRYILGNNSNVQGLADLSGNNFNVLNGNVNSGNVPVLVKNYTTNNLTSIVFDPSQSLLGRLRCDALAAFVTGNQPFTVIQMSCAQTNGNDYAWSFGWSGATNNAASIAGGRPSAGTTTTKAMALSFNTNSVIPQYTRVNGPTTNVFEIVSFGFDGTGNVRIISNTSSTTTAIPNVGVLTVDQFSLGGLIRASGTFANPWYGGIVEMQFYTNYLSTAQVQKWQNEMNSRLGRVF